MNLETLGLVIGIQETDQVREVLTKRQIVEAEFNEQANAMLPIKGQIKEKYLKS